MTSPFGIQRLVLWSRLFPMVALAVWVTLAIGVLWGAWSEPPHWPMWVIATLIVGSLLRQWQRAMGERWLREAPLPQFLKRKLRDAYPHLSQKDGELVERGLRQFFLACLRSRGQFVVMPSRAVDVLWHEFILHTSAYQRWCRDALGFFLHHTPAETLGRRAHHNDGLRRAWYWACKDEAIDPRHPSRLPLLFALDAKLAIPNGFHYQPNCQDIAAKSAAGSNAGQIYCGTDFASGHYCGDADGLAGCADNHADGGHSSDGDGGGGDGCGGGGD